MSIFGLFGTMPTLLTSLYSTIFFKEDYVSVQSLHYFSSWIDVPENYRATVLYYVVLLAVQYANDFGKGNLCGTSAPSYLHYPPNHQEGRFGSSMPHASHDSSNAYVNYAYSMPRKSVPSSTNSQHPERGVSFTSSAPDTSNGSSVNRSLGTSLVYELLVDLNLGNNIFLRDLFPAEFLDEVCSKPCKHGAINLLASESNWIRYIAVQRNENRFPATDDIYSFLAELLEVPLTWEEIVKKIRAKYLTD